MFTKNSVYFYVGVAMAGAMVGFVTGVSSSPLGTTVVTSVFGGLLGIGAGYISTKREVETETGSTERRRNLMGIWGMSLTWFSILFVVALFLGAFSRERWNAQSKHSLVIPWDSEQTEPPSTPEDAWRWLTFSRDAKELGLSTEHIKTLYRASKVTTSKQSNQSTPTKPSEILSADSPAPSSAPKPTPNTPPWPSYSRGGGGYTGKHPLMFAPEELY